MSKDIGRIDGMYRKDVGAARRDEIASMPNANDRDKAREELFRREREWNATRSNYIDNYSPSSSKDKKSTRSKKKDGCRIL